MKKLVLGTICAIVEAKMNAHSPQDFVDIFDKNGYI
jgi:hypothetical protein